MAHIKGIQYSQMVKKPSTDEVVVKDKPKPKPTIE